MPDTSVQLLFVILGENPRLSILAESPFTEVELAGVRYSLVDRQIGFYDFLRSQSGVIIGIRMCPFTTRPLLPYVASLDYVYVHDKGQYFEVYFRQYRGAVDGAPAEQAFGDDAIWRSDAGTYVLQVGTAELSEGDLDALRESVRVGE